MTVASLTYRREVDGLRAVAVLPVILFHAGFSVFSGGFVGVDVFFVISGYLITSIILREQREGRFSVLAFYERRARRILPALFLVMAACIPFALAWMLPAQLVDFGESLGAVSLFSSNILFWLETGYFEPVAELKPLLHTWSLAVEEQYYVLFPLILMAMGRLRLRNVALTIGLVTLLSLLATEWGWRNEPSANFYLLPTRAWELLAGSLLAIYLLRRPQPGGLVGEAGAAAGLLLIVGSMLMFDEETRFPSLMALVPVLGSVLVILCAQAGNWTGRLLGWSPMVGVGLISYSAYLWHQPLFAFARIRSVMPPSLVVMAVLAVLSLFLAWLTWKYVEAPFRDRARVSRKRIFAAAAAGIAAFCAVAAVLQLTGGLPARMSPEVLRLASFAEAQRTAPKGCVKAPELDGFCVFNPEQPRRVAIWGDSHALYLSGPLAEGLRREGVGLLSVTRAACTPILGLRRPAFRDCPAHNEKALAFLLSPQGPDTVILVSRWTKPFIGTPFDNREGGVEIDEPSIFYPAAGGSTPLSRPAIGEAARDTVERLLAGGKRVIIVGNVPEAGWNVPVTLIRMTQFGDGGRRPLTTDARVVKDRIAVVSTMFAPLRDRPGVTIVEPWPLFCDRQLAGRCVNEWQGQPLYKDDDHLSTIGAGWLVPEIVKSLEASPASPGPRR